MKTSKYKSTRINLKESERSMLTLLSNLPGMVYHCRNDRNWTMEFLSDGCLELTGYQPSDLINNQKLSFNEIIHPDDREQIWEKVQASLQKQQPFQLTYRIQTATGKNKWVWEKGSGIFSNKGELLYLEGFITDITEQIEAEDKIRKLNEELEQIVSGRTAQLDAANKELESFAYSVSHDLRAPLRAINGYGKILKENYSKNLDDEGNRFLNIILDSAKTMGTLIDDLLALSRLGRKKIRKSLVDMTQLTETALNELNKIVEHRAEVKINKLHPVVADNSLINQVMTNLLSNAIKYSSKKEKPVVEISSEKKDGQVVYSVTDNGAGFNMQYSDKLFGVFQRLHPQSEFEGTGVGLAIVKLIIRKHNGNVWAEGEVNEGATFYFSLPSEPIN